MRKICHVIGWMFQSIGAFLLVCVYIGGVALHLYTVLVAFQFWGFLSAMLALCVPFVAELVCFIVFWWKSGTLFNGYSFYALLFLFAVFAAFTLTALGTWVDQFSRDKEHGLDSV
jgi:hypothetical protein